MNTSPKRNGVQLCGKLCIIGHCFVNCQYNHDVIEKNTPIYTKMGLGLGSFPDLASKKSINDRVDIDTLKPLIYGFMFMRVIHMIHAMRFVYPNTTILICKLDLAWTYRRMHLSATTAVKYICSTKICALIYLRLIFGGSFSPAEWCILIELLTDFANDIINNPF